MAGLVCDIVTPAAKLLSDDAYMVVVPGVEGEMGFLHGHVPLVSVLADGVVRIQAENGGEMKRFALQGGYVQVTGQKVSFWPTAQFLLKTLTRIKCAKRWLDLRLSSPSLRPRKPR